MAAAPYPKIPSKAWNALRARAAAAPSTRLTPSSVAALMGMASPQSARTNIVRPLITLGLINDDGTLTARGNKWRLDPSYGEACQEIIDEIYPGELALLTNTDGATDLAAVRTWFDHKGFGGSNAQQMAATYVMIASKEIPDVATAEAKKDAPKKSTPAKPRSAATAKTPPAPNADETVVQSSAAARPATGGPMVHLDIQIHIPADASLEQIDGIFASMAKHIYKQ